MCLVCDELNHIMMLIIIDDEEFYEVSVISTTENKVLLDYKTFIQHQVTLFFLSGKFHSIFVQQFNSYRKD